MGDDAVVHAQQALDQPAHGAWVEHVLAGQHTRRQRCLGVARQHRHHGLRNDGTVIEFGGHEVHRRAGQLAARLDGTPVGVQAGEGRQQRGVHIHHAAFELLHEASREDAHEAGQHQHIGLVAAHDAGQFGIEGFAVGKSLVIDDRRGDAARTRKLQARRIVPAADDRGHARRPTFGGAGLHDGFHVGAAPRDQDHYVFHRAASVGDRPPQDALAR